ncbi:hypothetical protein Ccar_16250 [Clostridium carboxidivorans P7]|uniref:Uncharacterized protein n=1 Tax=Clostridium carboxidivorans P7 TaxID=536227 RepID=C6PT17_9CLOT|nr:hypothetical protein [Clostridium carboxidivorans]AKN32329.1 hypothetical protein Ccar_16250 [Clostridium carboxidivorans P7]EET87652.1 hypothetical protein CcarbDRAFT_1934 [Clostridium carboxidivorans P7]
MQNVQTKTLNLEGDILEAQDELEQIREEQFQQLCKALEYMKGHEVVADTLNEFMTYKAYTEFNYSLSENVDKEILLNLKDIDDRSEAITFKLDEVMDIDIDDNSEYLNGATDEQYECENIVITLWNESVLRLELQW